MVNLAVLIRLVILELTAYYALGVEYQRQYFDILPHKVELAATNCLNDEMSVASCVTAGLGFVYCQIRRSFRRILLCRLIYYSGVTCISGIVLLISPF